MSPFALRRYADLILHPGTFSSHSHLSKKKRMILRKAQTAREIEFLDRRMAHQGLAARETRGSHCKRGKRHPGEGYSGLCARAEKYLQNSWWTARSPLSIHNILFNDS